MTDVDVRGYEIKLMRECLEDAEKVIGTQNNSAAAYIAAIFFRYRKG